MSPEREPFAAECAAFLAANPDLERVELVLPDASGMLRGKWLPAASLATLAERGVRFPLSVHGETLFLSSRLDAEFGLAPGDPDGLWKPVPGTLCRIPWRQRPVAQLLLALHEEDGRTPHELDPRGHLARAEARLVETGHYPVVAMELEFCLYRPGGGGQARPVSGLNRLYELDALDDLAPFFDALGQAAAAQRIPLSGLVAEMAPGQFEANLAHVADACAAADHVVLLRRLVRRVAAEHGMDATFMAKPDGSRPGNGCHIHLSLVDAAGRNRFNTADSARAAAGTPLRHAVAGLLATAAEAQLVFAPNQNSLRRFTPGAFAPVQLAWGYDHRNAALRVPTATGTGARLEHRIAGADAQPYLLLAAVLGGVRQGLDRSREPPAPLIPEDATLSGPPLSSDFAASVARFRESDFVAGVFGRRFRDLFANVRELEQQELAAIVPDSEWQAYFRRP